MSMPELDAAGPIVGERRCRAAGGDAHVDVRLQFVERSQARDEPADGEGWSDTDRQHIRIGQHGDLRGEIGERVEDLREPGLIGPPARRQHKAVGRRSNRRTMRLMAAGVTFSSFAARAKLPPPRTP